MANLVKLKVSGSLIFLLILILIDGLISTKYYESQQYKEWHPDSILYVSDFYKLEPLFISNGFEAHIESQIGFLKFDDGTFSAITLIDRFESWFDDNPMSLGLLEHEAYHANITSIGTKMLNQQIIEDNLEYWEARREMKKIYKLMYELHSQYDNQTDHSLNVPAQYYWQYRVDSMFNADAEIQNTDVFSGASAYFSSQPEIYIRQDTFQLFKIFELNKNEMNFRLISYYDSFLDSTGHKDYFRQVLSKEKYTNIHSKSSAWNGLYMLETEYQDSISNKLFHDRIIAKGQNSYQLTYSHPIIYGGDSVYNLMKTTFFDSFQIEANESFWIEYLSEIDKQDLRDVTFTGVDLSDAHSTFTSLPYSDNSIIYHEPFIYDDRLIMAFKVERHDQSDIDQVFLQLNDSKTFSQTPDSLYQVISLDLKELKKEDNHIQFGYMTKSDSVKESYHFYSTVIDNFSILNKN